MMGRDDINEKVDDLKFGNFFERRITSPNGAIGGQTSERNLLNVHKSSTNGTFPKSLTPNKDVILNRDDNVTILFQTLMLLMCRFCFFKNNLFFFNSYCFLWKQ